MNQVDFDFVVVGGGPSGATAANDLAQSGWRVLLLDRQGRPKPCGGAIPPRLIQDFDIPDELLVAKIRCARMISPKDNQVDIPIDNGFVGMVDRQDFDEFLRTRAAQSGAFRQQAVFDKIERDEVGALWVYYTPVPDRPLKPGETGQRVKVSTRMVIGADGARSPVAKQHIPKADKTKYVFAYHEIIQSPDDVENHDAERCDVYYQGSVSPDFYGWVFPHGKTTSVGTGSADKGFSLRSATGHLRHIAGLADQPVLRREGAPIPLKPLPHWDNGRDILVVGDAAGVVAPSSGEGIYYAMDCGRTMARAAHEALKTGNPKHLKAGRKRFMKQHGKVFWILGVMQYFWYQNDKRREKFVKICEDKDVQKLTFDAYMNKELAKRDPWAHVRIFLKDMAHLLGLAKVG
jgi:geranylgeranyl reductase